MSPYEVTANYLFHMLTTSAVSMVWNMIKPINTLSKKAHKLKYKQISTLQNTIIILLESFY